MPLSPTEPFAAAGGACPTCGAPAARDQLVCLECGSRVALDYRKPPSWRVPVAIIVTVVLLVAVAAAIALSEIGDDAEREAGSTPIKVQPKPEEGAAREKAAASSELVQRGSLYTWPAGAGGFTVVLTRTADRAAADTFARDAAAGRPAKIGIIRTDDFRNLEKGFFVVFAGRYDSRELANRAADRLDERFDGAFAQPLER